MSETSQEARRALTEKRGAELDKWCAINFVRFFNCQDPSTMSDLPTEILVQILEKLDSMEQITCRKVCQNLKTVVEKFEINFASIWFNVENDHVDMNLDGLDILYKDAANGFCIMTYNNKETMIKGENFLQLAFKDLGILLKHVRYFDFRIYGEDEHAIATYLLNALKANQCVHVKTIEISYMPLIDICSILPYFDSQILESIELYCDETNEHSEQLVQLEQWKNAKYCTVRGSLGDSIPIEHLLHFKSFDVDMKEFTLRNMIEIRDKLLIRSTFEECFVWLKKSISIEVAIEIARVFQPNYSGSEAFEIEYMCNNDKFKINSEKTDFLRKWRLIIKRC